MSLLRMQEHPERRRAGRPRNPDHREGSRTPGPFFIGRVSARAYMKSRPRRRPYRHRHDESEDTEHPRAREWFRRGSRLSLYPVLMIAAIQMLVSTCVHPGSGRSHTALTHLAGVAPESGHTGWACQREPIAPMSMAIPMPTDLCQAPRIGILPRVPRRSPSALELTPLRYAAMPTTQRQISMGLA
jgi:hypothetical protein